MATVTDRPALERVKQRLAPKKGGPLPTSVITVRMTRATHRALVELAHDLRVSLNRLCVAALEEVTDEPAEEPPTN